MDLYFFLSPESSRDRPLEIKHTAYPLLTWTLSVTAYDNIRNWQALTSAADAPASVTCKRSTCWNLIQSQVCWVKASSSSKQPQENDSGKDWHVPVKGSFVSNVGNYGKSYPKRSIIFSTVRVVKTERLMGRNYCTNPLVVMTTVKSKKHSHKNRFILPKILFIRVFLNLLEFQKNVHFSNFNNDKQIHIWPNLTSHNNGSPK